jgi:hypothetical protein
MDEKEYDEILKNIEKYKEKFKVRDGKLYRLKDEKELRVIRRYELEGLMYLMHDHELSAHFGSKATYEKVKEKYWWKGMIRDIEGYVKTCDSCQRRNKPIGKHELNSIEVKEPFYMIGIDIVGPLPRTVSGKKYIVVAMDYFTKWPEAKALEEANAKEVSTFIYEDIICRHGCPHKILTDRGSHFNNQMVRELMEKFRVKHGFSTPYHPKTNGLVERFNKTLCESLAKLGGKDWDKRIAPVLFAYRSKNHSSTGMTPFYLTYGRKVILPNSEEIKGISMVKRVEVIIEELPKIRIKQKKI